MTFKIFLTGATGYIGGTVFQTLVSKHPEYEISILQRTPKPELSLKYPSVKIIQGDYDSTEIVTHAASQANCVVHNGDTDHEACLSALLAGLKSRPTSSPSFLIQLSGTGIISDWQAPSGGYGNRDPKVWSDITDIDAIWSAPDDALHRPVDRIIQEAFEADGESLKTAIVCGPDIYGLGTGPGKKISILLPFYIEECLRLTYPFYVGRGQNTRSWVHVTDLVQIHLSLIEAAAAGGAGADWNEAGYYFASSQEISQLELAQAVGKILERKGLIHDEMPLQVSVHQVRKMRSGKFGDVPGIALFMLASSSRSTPDRARRKFGYEARAKGLLEELEVDVDAALEAINGSGR